MKKILSESLSKAVKFLTENPIFLIIGAVILIIPIIATTGQFLNISYFNKIVPILLFYWPGSDLKLEISMPVFLFMGLVFISYFAGIAYLVRKRNLGKVILITIGTFIISGLIKVFLSKIFGWQENALPDLTGKANALILSLWHNPIWEEIFFRGIPLLILLTVEKYLLKKRNLFCVLIYCMIPSAICGIYHIPGHGIIRFFDSFFIGIVFSLLALRYTLFAPVVMHYIADAMLVLNLNKIPTIQVSEIEWIIQYGKTLNTLFFLLTLALLFLVPVLMIYYFTKQRTQLKSFAKSVI